MSDEIQGKRRSSGLVWLLLLLAVVLVWWFWRPPADNGIHNANDREGADADEILVDFVDDTGAARVAEIEARFGGAEVPRPSTWGGFRLVPDTVELWQGRPNRLHDRLRYQHPEDAPTRWEIVRLSP